MKETSASVKHKLKHLKRQKREILEVLDNLLSIERLSKNDLTQIAMLKKCKVSLNVSIECFEQLYDFYLRDELLYKDVH